MNDKIIDPYKPVFFFVLFLFFSLRTRGRKILHCCCEIIKSKKWVDGRKKERKGRGGKRKNRVVMKRSELSRTKMVVIIIKQNRTKEKEKKEMVGAKGSPVSRVPCRARCRYMKGSNHVTYLPSCRFVLCSDNLFTLPLLSDPTFRIFTSILIHLLSLLAIFWKCQLHYFS